LLVLNGAARISSMVRDIGFSKSSPRKSIVCCCNSSTHEDRVFRSSTFADRQGRRDQGGANQATQGQGLWLQSMQPGTLDDVSSFPLTPGRRPEKQKSLNRRSGPTHEVAALQPAAREQEPRGREPVESI